MVSINTPRSVAVKAASGLYLEGLSLSVFIFFIFEFVGHPIERPMGGGVAGAGAGALLALFIVAGLAGGFVVSAFIAYFLSHSGRMRETPWRTASLSCVVTVPVAVGLSALLFNWLPVASASATSAVLFALVSRIPVKRAVFWAWSPVLILMVVGVLGGGLLQLRANMSRTAWVALSHAIESNQPDKVTLAIQGQGFWLSGADLDQAVAEAAGYGKRDLALAVLLSAPRTENLPCAQALRALQKDDALITEEFWKSETENSTRTALFRQAALQQAARLERTRSLTAAVQSGLPENIYEQSAQNLARNGEVRAFCHLFTTADISRKKIMHKVIQNETAGVAAQILSACPKSLAIGK